MVYSQPPADYPFTPAKIVLLTGLSNPRSCALSDIQLTFLSSLDVPESWKVYRNFPWVDGEDQSPLPPLWKASLHNAWQFLLASTPLFRRIARPHWDAMLRTTEHLFVLTGSCGLQIVNCLQHGRASSVPRIDVLGFGPVAWRAPKLSCRLVQGDGDALSRLLFRKVDYRLAGLGHMRYLEDQRMKEISGRMDIRQNFKIIGSGVYFPKKEVDAEEIDARLGKAPGWTRENIGVNRRFECVPPESIATMAAEAVTRAMDAAKVEWSDIDLILDCSTSRYRPIPCNAIHVQSMCAGAAQSIPCFDIQTTCLGFIVAVHVANSLMQTGGYRHILITCSEAALAGVDWGDPESASIFGDAAVAFVLKFRESVRRGRLRAGKPFGLSRRLRGRRRGPSVARLRLYAGRRVALSISHGRRHPDESDV